MKIWQFVGSAGDSLGGASGATPLEAALSLCRVWGGESEWEIRYRQREGVIILVHEGRRARVYRPREVKS